MLDDSFSSVHQSRTFEKICVCIRFDPAVKFQDRGSIAHEVAQRSRFGFAADAGKVGNAIQLKLTVYQLSVDPPLISIADIAGQDMK